MYLSYNLLHVIFYFFVLHSCLLGACGFKVVMPVHFYMQYLNYIALYYIYKGQFIPEQI